MSGIFGWTNTNLRQANLRSTVVQMASGLSPLGDEFSGEHSKSSAYYAKSLSEGFSASTNRKVNVVVDGSLDWSDSEFADCANTQGPAAALSMAYRKSGLNCIKNIKGKFALAIIDQHRNTTILAVDRMGKRPLCYALTADEGLVFASTAEAVRSHPSVTSSVDPQAIFDYLYFHIVPSPLTVYSQIRKLEPGQCLVFRDGQLRLMHHWYPSFEESPEYHLDDLKEELRHTLWTAVRRCKKEINTGSFLSGGLDSSTVSGILAKITEQPAYTFAIGFDAAGYDEMPYARIASRHFGTKLHEYYLTPEDIIQAIPEIAEAYDEPFGNASAVPALICARLAFKSGIRLILAGDGGDELFAGNAHYARQQVFSVYERVPKWFRSNLIEPLLIHSSIGKHTWPVKKLRSYVGQARIPMPERLHSYNFMHRVPLESIYTSDFLKTVDTRHPLTLLKDVYDRAPTQSLLNRMLYLDWKFTLADNDLRKVNCMSEWAGIDVCFPMLDDDLIDFSIKLPPSLKLQRTKLRYFFKEALNDFLPAEIITKRKHGFGLPFGIWLKSSPELQKMVYESLNALKSRHIIRNDFIDDLVDTHLGGHEYFYGTMIWVLLMLEQWFQQHQVDFT